MFNLNLEITALVTARQDLLDGDDYGPAFTRAMNKLDAKLDDYPWLDVLRAEKALLAERAAAMAANVEQVA